MIDTILILIAVLAGMGLQWAFSSAFAKHYCEECGAKAMPNVVSALVRANHRADRAERALAEWVNENVCATCEGNPEVCAKVPGLRHCEAANRVWRRATSAHRQFAEAKAGNPAFHALTAAARNCEGWVSPDLLDRLIECTDGCDGCVVDINGQTGMEMLTHGELNLILRLAKKAQSVQSETSLIVGDERSATSAQADNNGGSAR